MPQTPKEKKIHIMVKGTTGIHKEGTKLAPNVKVNIKRLNPDYEYHFKEAKRFHTNDAEAKRIALIHSNTQLNGYDFNFDIKNLRLASVALNRKWSGSNGKLDYKKLERSHISNVRVEEDRIHYNQPKGKYDNIDAWKVVGNAPSRDSGTMSEQLGFFKSKAEAERFVGR